MQLPIIHRDLHDQYMCLISVLLAALPHLLKSFHDCSSSFGAASIACSFSMPLHLLQPVGYVPSRVPLDIGQHIGRRQTSSGKKTRTKPIRNAEGILIRKDGRPDMRSVSSANNLRKVHAKKEAERAEMDGQLSLLKPVDTDGC